MSARASRAADEDPAHLIARLEDRFRPKLETARATLEERFPRVGVTIESNTSTGRRGPNSHSLALDCILHDPEMEPVEQISMTIELRSIRRAAQLDSEVCWSSGDVEARLAGAPMDVNPSAFEALEQQFEALVRAMASAIARGGPPDPF
jgi:hypothetical protein